MAVAKGEPFLGTFPTTPGPVTYFALEDGKRRLQDRLTRIWGAAYDIPLYFVYSLIESRTLKEHILASYQFRLHPEEKPALAHQKLIIIDTLGQAVAQTGVDFNSYDQMTALLQPLHDLAEQLHSCILFLHHIRKSESDDPFDRTLGSTALNGVADTMLILRRGRFHSEASLSITGRDVEEKELGINFANGRWVHVGDAKDVPPEPLDRRLLEVLRKTKNPLTTGDIHRQLGGHEDESTVSRHLYRLREQGFCTFPARGVWLAKGAKG